MCAGPHIDDLVWGNMQILTTQQGNLLVVIASSSLANAQHCIDSIAFKAGVLFFKLVEKGFYPVIKFTDMLGNCLHEHEWMSTFCICVCFHLSLYLCLFYLSLGICLCGKSCCIVWSWKIFCEAVQRCLKQASALCTLCIIRSAMLAPQAMTSEEDEN